MALPPEEQTLRDADSAFLWNLIHRFLDVLITVPEPMPSGEIDRHRLRYCERVLELLTDLEALLPTRRFFNVLLHASHVDVKCSLSKLATEMEEEGHLFRQMLERLKFYAGFEINDFSGEALTDNEMLLDHYNAFISLQKATFKQFGAELNKFSLANVGSVDTRDQLTRHFKALSKEQLVKIAAHLHLLEPVASPEELVAVDGSQVLEILVSKCERRTSQLEALNVLPLYPTEQIIWDENIVPSEYYSGEGCLALPKLNLQFLTLHDYLLRNFTLFRLESTYEIREDIQDNVVRMKPFKVGLCLGHRFSYKGFPCTGKSCRLVRLYFLRFSHLRHQLFSSGFFVSYYSSVIFISYYQSLPSVIFVSYFHPIFFFPMTKITSASLSSVSRYLTFSIYV